MNKQETVKGIEDEKILGFTTYEDERYNEGLITALSYVEAIDEPEKPVLTKEEAKWIKKLKARYISRENQLYIITRQGWGNDFCFSDYGEQVKLPYEYGEGKEDTRSVKRRLVDAIIYGYEVEKEKLYRARHKLTGEYLSQNYTKTGYYHGLDHFHILKLSKKDWEELGVLDNKMYEIEEVEE
ncbi:DUF1642 domain-containing protein [Streptococcus ruminicola]|uniref:DUF1642 domain-containing protein n=1 Tax=Streptococcus ruminicola TaxID=2686210 RepID=A0A6G8HY08_9STRE|nr:DUF1642 domain-containing protein [Streptococcus ruminicola]QIM45749.1 DUF1642 domain-containing protein [Streptococcus ruminicola]